MRALIFNDTTPTMHHGCNAVMRVLTDRLAERGIEPMLYWPVGKDWHNHRAKLASEASDMVIVNGEGSIHHSAERERARYLCQIATFARETLEIPAYLVNASVSALDEDTLDHMRSFSAIWVRETESADYLRERNIAATRVADLSIGLSLETDERARHGILVTDSVVSEADAVLRKFARRTNCAFESMRVAAIEKRRGFFDRLGRSIAKRIRHPEPFRRNLRETSDYRNFVKRLQASELVITGRFHTVTLCLLTQTPFVAVASNTRKIQSTLVDALGGESRVIALGALETSGLDSLQSRFGMFSDDERARLSLYRSRSRHEIGRMLDAIVSDAGAGS